MKKKVLRIDFYIGIDIRFKILCTFTFFFQLSEIFLSFQKRSKMTFFSKKIKNPLGILQMLPIMLDCQSLKPKFNETKKLWPNGVELGRIEEPLTSHSIY